MSEHTLVAHPQNIAHHTSKLFALTRFDQHLQMRLLGIVPTHRPKLNAGIELIASDLVLKCKRELLGGYLKPRRTLDLVSGLLE